MELLRIIFYSENKTNFTGTSMKDLAKGILESCTRHDPGSCLTGALLFNETYFVQVMEGDRKSISAKMWSLANDSRHSTMVLLGAEDIKQRAFSTWSVAFAGHSDGIDSLYLRFSAGRSLDPTVMTASGVLSLVDEFVHGGHGQFVKHAEKVTMGRAA